MNVPSNAQTGKPAVPDLSGCCGPTVHDAAHKDTESALLATVYNAGSNIRSVEACGKRGASKRLVMVVTGKYVDLMREQTFARFDRIRFQLGPLVSAHLVTGSLLGKRCRGGVDTMVTVVRTGNELSPQDHVCVRCLLWFMNFAHFCEWVLNLHVSVKC